MNKIKSFFSISLMIGLVSYSFAGATVTPPAVSETLALGESVVVNKTVTTPEIPPMLDVCLLEDETASFGDDIHNLQTAAPVIYDQIIATGADAHFAVAGFRDYPIDPYGDPYDHVYRLLTLGMSDDRNDWLNGVASLTAGGGNDVPEAQYDAIVAAAGPGQFNDPTLGFQNNCGWRSDPGVTRVLVVATDAPFHTTDGTHVNNEVSTIAALTAQNIIVVGLKATTGSPGGELDALALATGGSVQPLSNDGANIADAILAGLSSIMTTVTPYDDCDKLDVTFSPTSQTVTSGDPANFVETITVPNDTSLAGTVQTCTVEFRDNGNVLGIQDIMIRIPIAIDLTPESETNELGFDNEHTVTALIMSGLVPIPELMVNFEILSGPNAGETHSEETNEDGEAQFTYEADEAEQGDDGLGTDIIRAYAVLPDSGGNLYARDVEKDWTDTTPPEAQCVETVNPSGKNIPPAGSIPPPGSKNGQNEDGFYELLAEDVVSFNVEVYVEDMESGKVFGPFVSGTKIKYTEVASEPRMKAWGNDKSKADAIEWHIFGNGDAAVYAVDLSGNQSDPISCLVPPLPK